MLRAVVLALAPVAWALGSTDTITWGGDNSRAGYQTNHNMDPSVVGSSDFAQIFRTALPGNYNGAAEQIFSQPLVYTPSNGSTQYVYVATTQNNVYKLDAATGVILASRSLGIPFLTAELDGCVDVNPLIGVTATGVVDPETDTIYYTSKTYADQGAGNGVQGRGAGRYLVHAVSAYDLSDRPNFPVDLEGLVARNNPTRMFTGGIHHQRPGLLHVGQYVYAGFASHCVQYNFTGWIVGWDKTTGAIVEQFATEGAGVPNTVSGAGIWMSGGGLASDDAGSMFFATGNGYASQLATVPVEGRSPPTSLEEAAVHASINADGSLSIVDFFMPREKQELDGADHDLGTSPLEILPPAFSCGRVARIGVVTGKSGKTYWLDLDDLGGYRTGVASGDRVLQVYENENSVYAGAGVYPLEGGYIYINVIQYKTHVFKFSCIDGVPAFTKVADSPEVNGYVLGVSHGTVTSLDGQPGTGLLWTTDIAGKNLRIYDAVPVDGVLTEINSFVVPGTTKFTRAVFGDGRMYMGTTTGFLYGFGGPTVSALDCASPVVFGSHDVTEAGATVEVTCTAVTATTVTAVTLRDGDANSNFGVATDEALPRTLAAGASFTFRASFRPTTVGNLTASASIATANDAAGYTSKTPVLLRGEGVSQDALLVLGATSLVFANVVVGQNASDTQPLTVRNAGRAALAVQDVLVADTANGPWTRAPQTDDAYVAGAFSLHGVPGALAAGAGATAQVLFAPTAGGNASAFFRVVSSGGNATVALSGNAGPAARALIEFQTPDDSGWTAYTPDTPFSFGNVTENTSRTLQLRITNVGGVDAVPLSLTVSKPPFGVAGLVQANNNVDLAEGTVLAAGQSASASLFCAVPKSQWNVDAYTGSAVWTLNTNDPDLGKQILAFHCTAVAEQAPPLADTGDALFRYQGCFRENNPGRQLATQLYSSANNTVALCIAACAAAALPYCGTQYGAECWGGPTAPIEQTADDNCNYPCAGNLNQVCGGNGVGADAGGAFISLFATNETLVPMPGGGSTAVVNPGVAGYAYQGCYAEPHTGRALSQQLVANQTVAACLAAARASNYAFAGVEYGGECWAGNAIAAGTNITAASDCSMPCNGNATEVCGGALLLNMYARNTTTTPDGGSVGENTVPSSVSSSLPSATPAPTVNPGVAGYAYQGCYAEPHTGRALSQQLAANQTVASCLAAAHAAGLAVAGLEYGGECWAGRVLAPGTNLTVASDCSMPCNANATEICGAGLRLSVYARPANASSTGPASVSASAAPTPTTRPTVAAGWDYLGCYTEGTASRALAAAAVDDASMSYDLCASFCSDYAFFGVEYGSQCYCGNYFTAGSVPVAESDCSTACAGDPATLCGGPDLLNVFQHQDHKTGQPVAQAQVGDFAYLGCYSEPAATRALASSAVSRDNMTQEACASFCDDYAFFGVEYASQCYCGHALANGTARQPDAACAMACVGDAFELCGGPDLLNVWSYSPAAPTTTSAAPTNARNVSGVLGPLAAEATTSVPVSPSVSAVSAAPSSAGNVSVAASSTATGSVSSVSSSLRLATAPSSTLVTSHTTSTSVSPSNSSSASSSSAVSTTPATPRIDLGNKNYTLVGCYREPSSGHLLATRVANTTALTVDSCLSTCAAFRYAGVENSDQCWCGNALTLAGDGTGTHGAPVANSSCSDPCAGNATAVCGALGKMLLYNSTVMW